MSLKPSLDNSRNKKFVIDNKFFLKQYVLKNNNILGKGIVVVNLLLLKTDILDEKDVFNYETEIEEDQELTIHHAVSYIPQNNFWFKMLSLKIKKKYDIDIADEDKNHNKFLIVFVKDTSVEHFSIYSLKL